MPDRPTGAGRGGAASAAGAAATAASTAARGARLRLRRSLGSPQLFAIIWTSLASAIYFSLGVVSGHALGLTPLVFLLAGLYFVITAMTYVEGASLHQDRAGSTVFARYAFNELFSFVAGWAILLDYVILIAVTSFAAANYMAAFWPALGHGAPRLIVALGVIAYVAVRNVLGFSKTRLRRVAALVIVDLALQLIVIVVGLVLFFNVDTLTGPIQLGSSPQWGDVIFALTIATVAFTSLESASGLAGEVAIGRRGLKRLVGSAAASVIVVYVGIALVAVTALPVSAGATPLGSGHDVNAPVLAIIARFHPAVLADSLKYAVAAAAALTLVAASNSAMMGLSRLAYSLGTNRQIPSVVGQLHPRRSTPFVVIIIAALLAAALVLPADLELLVGIYAFGATLAFTIAHLSICVLRYREPERDRPYRVPLSLRVRGADLPLLAVLGALLSLGAWISVLVLHNGARNVGLSWMAGGLLLYVIYRRTQGKSLLRRVTVPEQVLRHEPRDADVDYGSVLVALSGSKLDDDIVQTAALLVAGEQTDVAAIDRATIEAVWIFEVPMSLPIDASLPESQLKRARAALARAKVVGEEYTGVEVATATVRARRAGLAIVDEARRRGVEAIVLGAEEPSRIRGGLLLGGRAPLEDFVGDTIKYVVTKAPCRVILTAPPARPGGDGAAQGERDLPAATSASGRSPV